VQSTKPLLIIAEDIEGEAPKKESAPDARQA
jgi:hypothetical protein